LRISGRGCDGAGGRCTDLAGEIAASYPVTVNDVGHTLRAVVSASNLGGSASSTATASAVVRPRPLPPPERPTVMRAPVPTIGTTMTWSFDWKRSHTRVKALVIHDLPAGGKLEIACSGRGCPVSRRRWTIAVHGHACHGGRCMATGDVLPPGRLDLAILFGSRRLTVGARIRVTVSKPGLIGKSFEFAVRGARPPRVEIGCLIPGSNTVASEC
jgi:hypothetical protein